MAHLPRALIVGALVATVLCISWSEGANPQAAGIARPTGAKKVKKEIQKLIDQLVELGEGDVLYSDFGASLTFLPLHRPRGNVVGFHDGNLLSRYPPGHADTVRELAKFGVAALPHLAAHLNDKRPTRIVVEQARVDRSGRIDWNVRTDGPLAAADDDMEPDDAPRQSYTLTVGDLCLLTIGQIVNRGFHPVHQTPNDGWIRSPNRSKELRDKVRETWAGLTPRSHRDSLVEDFLKPDSDSRWHGAYERLAYYYPDTLEPLLLKFLARRDQAGETLSEEDWRGRIFEGLICDRSAKVDRAFCNLLTTITDDDYLAGACRMRLIGRGFDAEIKEFCDRRLQKDCTEAEASRFKVWLKELGYTRLHVAVERQELDEVRRLLREKANVNATSCIGATPLHLAAASGDAAVVRELLGAGAALDPRDAEGLTAVQIAIEFRHFDVAALLVQRGCAIPDVLTAAFAGRADLIEPLYKNDPKAGAAATRESETALHLAAYFGRTAAADALLACGAAPNSRNSLGQTPLHFAAALGHAGVVRALICAGADVRGKQRAGIMEPLHLAAERGHVRVVELLLLARAPIEQKCAIWNQTPLYLAVARGHTDVAEVLLKRGADKEAVCGFEGLKPLHIAARSGNVKIAELLLADNAFVNPRDEHGETPLHDAVRSGSAAMVRLLLARDADSRLRNDSAQTPLELARKLGRSEIVELLKKGDG
jgi:ankyrin repeat protein